MQQTAICVDVSQNSSEVEKIIRIQCGWRIRGAVDRKLMYKDSSIQSTSSRTWEEETMPRKPVGAFLFPSNNFLKAWSIGWIDHSGKAHRTPPHQEPDIPFSNVQVTGSDSVYQHLII